MHYKTSDGCWSVEIVNLSCTPDKHDGEWIRVRHYGFTITDVRRVEALAEYVDLRDLAEG